MNRLFIGFDIHTTVIAVVETIVEIERVTPVQTPHDSYSCSDMPYILMSGIGGVVGGVVLLQRVRVECILQFTPQIRLDRFADCMVGYLYLRPQIPVGAVVFVITGRDMLVQVVHADLRQEAFAQTERPVLVPIRTCDADERSMPHKLPDVQRIFVAQFEHITDIAFEVGELRVLVTERERGVGFVESRSDQRGRASRSRLGRDVGNHVET